MYYGEELGMENNDPVRKEDVKDPIGIAGLAGRKRPRRRAHAHAVERFAERRVQHGETVVAGSRQLQNSQRRERIKRS